MPTGGALRAHVVPSRARPARLLFLVHGYASSELHIAALAGLVDPARRHVMVAPRGPIELPRRHGAAWMRPRRQEPEQFATSLGRLEMVLDEQCERHGVAGNDVVVGGFSQGAILAIALAARPRGPVPAGVVCWSGALPLDRGVDVDLSRLAGVPVLLLAGVHDEVIPIGAQRAAASALGSCGAELTAREYDAGHDVTIEMLADTRDWLASLGQPSA